MALVYIRPDADTDDGDWVNASGNNTNLYDSVNESVASDSDYIRSGNNPVNDIVKLRLGDFASVPAEPMTVRYRFKKVVSAGEILSLKVRLVEGDAPGTTIAEWEHDGVSDTYTDGEQELTSGQFALVSDFDDLYLEFEAISGALEVIEPGPFDGSYLLIDEDEGYAINAMYPGDPDDAAFVGAPIGGSVAVIDAGTPANDLDDVPLDSSNLTQAGTSAKTVHWHEAPYVRWSPHNYFTQSQTLDHSDWNTYATNCTVTANTSVAPDGTTTADTLTATAGGVAFINSGEANEPVAHVPYTYSAYLKQGTETWAILYFDDNTGGSVYCYYDLANGVLGTSGSNIMTLISTAIVSAGNGWWRCSITFEPNDAGAGIRRNRIHIADADGDDSPAASATILAWGVQKNRGPIALPYLVTTSAHRIGIPQSYDINEDMFGVLVEPAATNLQISSENMSFGGTSWAAEGGSVTTTTDAIIAPDGSLSGDRLNEAATTTQHSWRSNNNTLTAAVHTISIFARAGTRNWLAFSFLNESDSEVYFDLTNGVTGDVGSAVSAYAISAVGNGWYRCAVTMTTTSNSSSFGGQNIRIARSDGDDATYLGDTGENLYIWGAQTETGSVATSYIPTLGSTVTRADDIVTALISTMPALDTAVTIYAAFKAFNTGTSQTFLSISDSGGTNNHSLSTNGSNPIATTTVSSSAQADFSGSDTQAYDVISQVQYAAAANDFDYVYQDNAIRTDSSGTMPTLTGGKVCIGNFNGAGWFLTGFFYRLVIVPRQVETDDSNLEAWRYNF